jgi:hypothetical protein
MSGMFTFDDTNIKRMERDLQTFARRAVPFATRTTLTRTAFEARNDWQEQIDKNLINRNQWTRRSVRVEQARGLDVDTMEARVGSIADYMETTEEGGTESGQTGAHSIPTSYAAGQKGQRPPTRVARRRYRMPNIRIESQPDKQYASRAQEIYLKMLMAVRSGQRFIFMEDGSTRGIYEVKGRVNARGALTNVKVNMVQDLSRRSVTISPTPTLQPALDIVGPKISGIYREAVLEQLKRNRVLMYGRGF